MTSFVSVKKMFAILFLITYMLSTTELIQLLKLPVLVEHYAEHKAHNSDITILEFMTLHYNGDHLDNHPEDDDYDQDKKLPFITHNNVLTVCCTGVPNFLFELQNRIPQSGELKRLVYNDIFSSNTFLSTIWQPPKYA
ncbi:hypothetical protein CLV99_1522 [Sphingobacterium yanglingense]|uniref:Uncharacterized protein n=2 Tax=Sphingobacterium yanglingense TaxID=1437280 RepID=A0A4R6WML0_9SPHI|nr:hypothetical protein CLV99_1522 [Sphingobacterium yanglingense]